MNISAESFKLVELRAKTDRQLTEYINRRLESGLNFARLALDPDAQGRWASMQVFQDQARESLREAGKLLSVVSQPERRRLTGKLNQLRDLLETRANEPCLRAACF